MEQIVYRPIGVIRTPFGSPQGTPIQPAGARGVAGRVELEAAYAPALADLAGFSHILLVYHFHLAGAYRPAVVPYLDDRPRGLFATRAPARPNPIGISVVRLAAVEAPTLHVLDVDVVDGTPLLDLKPYVPEFDAHPGARSGWLAGRAGGAVSKRGDGRFSPGR